jgi:3-phosphoshikimate 1-carboxyvinyltransferase
MMTDSIHIQPVSEPIQAEVTVPGSKSDTNRALIAAALADGQSVLRGALFSDDTRYMMDALRTLGFSVASNEPLNTISIQGLNGHIPVSDADLFLGNSGTSIRFLAAFVALGRGRYRLDGIERMRQRPIQPLLDGLTQLGVKARSEQKPQALKAETYGWTETRAVSFFLRFFWRVPARLRGSILKWKGTWFQPPISI